MSVAAATIVDRSHIALGRVLAGSFRSHHPEIPFYLLLADQAASARPFLSDEYELVRFEDIEIPDRERFCFRYSQLPLSYACTPFLLERLLHMGHDRVLFFKQESLIFGRVDDAIDRLNSASLLLTPHLVTPLTGADAVERERRILLSGVYNVGLVGVSNTAEARSLLAWWADRVQENCLHAVGGGMHYEQRWMDLATSYFDGVELLRDPAYNVAHWNLPERTIEHVGDEAQVDGRPVRLFRFSGFDPDHPDRPTRYVDHLQMTEIGAAAELFSLYLEMLAEAGWWETRELPYAWGRFDNGVPIADLFRELYRDLERAGNAFEEPFSSTRPEGFYRWLTRRVDAAPDAAGITNLWHNVWQRRPDLQRAYPEPLAHDREAYLVWTRRTGVDEYGIPVSLWGEDGA
jgi:hypothetical protein